MNIKSVAKKAGVSVATVSRVLNHPDVVAEETKEHVLAVMEQLDYTPNWFARGLKLNRTGVISLLIPEILDFGYMEIAKGVEDVTRQKGCSMILCSTEGDVQREKEQIENILVRKVDGIILSDSLLNKSQIEAIKKEQVPVVCIGKNKEFSGENMVYTDCGEAAAEAAKHLMEIGYRQMAVIAGVRPAAETQDKLNGFHQALTEAGLPLDKHRVITEENSIEGGYLAAAKLLKRTPMPEAVFVTSDVMAMGVMESLKQAGLHIPEDIAVVGFDNLKVSAFLEPKLTTVAKPTYRMGLLAARLIFDLLEDKWAEAPQEIMIQSKLKVRKSCGHKDRLKEIF